MGFISDSWTMTNSCPEKHGERLSSMPDSLLEHVLSLLPTIDAVRTTALSSRFRDLWTSVLTIYIEDCRWCESTNETCMIPASWLSFSRFVNGIFMHHRRPTLEKFTLKFSCNFDDLYYEGDERPFTRALEDVSSWIWWAVSRKPKFLDLTLPECYTCLCKYLLPRVWNCDTIVRLRLELDFCGPYAERINTTSLKILTLSKVFFHGEMFQDIIQGCPALEELNLEDVNLGRLSFNAPGIQKLRVEDIQGITVQKVIIDCPNLVYLFFKGHTVDTEFVNLSSLTVAEFDDAFFDNFDSFSGLMKTLWHAQTLTLSDSFLGMFAFAKLNGLSCSWNRSKHTIANASGTYLEGLSELLRRPRHLERFTINMNPVAGELPKDVIQELQSFMSDYFDNLDYECDDQFCLRTSLRRITICGCDKHTHHIVIYLARVLLQNAAVLDEFTIKVKGKREGDELTVESSHQSPISLLPPCFLGLLAAMRSQNTICSSPFDFPMCISKVAYIRRHLLSL